MELSKIFLSKYSQEKLIKWFQTNLYREATSQIDFCFYKDNNEELIVRTFVWEGILKLIWN